VIFHSPCFPVSCVAGQTGAGPSEDDAERWPPMIAEALGGFTMAPVAPRAFSHRRRPEASAGARRARLSHQWTAGCRRANKRRDISQISRATGLRIRSGEFGERISSIVEIAVSASAHGIGDWVLETGNGPLFFFFLFFLAVAHRSGRGDALPTIRTKSRYRRQEVGHGAI